MRSINAWPVRLSCSGESGEAELTLQATPRSMRKISPKPQACAMSVALLDHGEIVPVRGTAKNRGASTGGGGAGSPDSSKDDSRDLSSASSGAAQ
jgi:hypothetical protein